MKTTIFIHNGDAKTGTSFIQNFLDVNRFKLFSDHQCLYPNFNNDQLNLGRCHNHSLWYTTIKNDQNKLKKEVEKLANFVRANNINKIILSNESWFLQKEDIDILRKILELHPEFELKTISYLRRVDFWFESAWKQWGLKQYNSPEEFSELGLIQERFEGILNYLEQWAEVIKVNNVIVRAYEKSQLPKGLAYDFITSIGINFEDTEWNSTENTNLAKNIGFNRDVLEILHHCKILFSDIHDNHLFDLFTEHLSKEFKKRPFEDYALISPKRKLDIIKVNLPYEKQIAEKFMGREGGTVFNDPLPDPNEPWTPYQGLNLETTIPILIKLIDENNRIIKDQKRKISDLEYKILTIRNGNATIINEDSNSLANLTKKIIRKLSKLLAK